MITINCMRDQHGVKQKEVFKMTKDSGFYLLLELEGHLTPVDVDKEIKPFGQPRKFEDDRSTLQAEARLMTSPRHFWRRCEK